MDVLQKFKLADTARKFSNAALARFKTIDVSKVAEPSISPEQPLISLMNRWKENDNRNVRRASEILGNRLDSIRYAYARAADQDKTLTLEKFINKDYVRFYRKPSGAKGLGEGIVFQKVLGWDADGWNFHGQNAYTVKEDERLSYSMEVDRLVGRETDEKDWYRASGEFTRYDGEIQYWQMDSTTVPGHLPKGRTAKVQGYGISLKDSSGKPTGLDLIVRREDPPLYEVNGRKVMGHSLGGYPGAVLGVGVEIPATAVVAYVKGLMK